jgi:hypothetical protein
VRSAPGVKVELVALRADVEAEPNVEGGGFIDIGNAEAIVIE